MTKNYKIIEVNNTIADESKVVLGEKVVFWGTKKQCEAKLTQLQTQKQPTATMPQIAQQQP